MCYYNIIQLHDFSLQFIYMGYRKQKFKLLVLESLVYYPLVKTDCSGNVFIFFQIWKFIFEFIPIMTNKKS